MNATPEEVAQVLEAVGYHGAAALIRAQAERVRVLEARVAELETPEWFFDDIDGESGGPDIESIIDNMDMDGVMRVGGARQVWRKWVARKCLTLDEYGDPDEVTYETFETIEEAEKCWAKSLADCRARAALNATGAPQ